MKKILCPAYSLKLKIIILFFNRGLNFFLNGHIRNVVSTLPDVVKIDFENDNVVSTLSNVVQFNVEKHNVISTLFNVVNFNVGVHNVISTLFNVVNFNVDVHNVVSTLIWICATPRRHINLKTTLKRRWNVCWDTLVNLALFFSVFSQTLRYCCHEQKKIILLNDLLGLAFLMFIKYCFVNLI